MEAATRANEITKEYYYVVRGMMLRGTTHLVARKSNHRGYETYHLIGRIENV